jgi:hypothetical protein
VEEESGIEVERGTGPQLSVTVPSAADIVCTVTNTYIFFPECVDAQDNSEDVEDTDADYPADLGCSDSADHDEDGTARLEVRKQLVPSTDPARFALRIDETADRDSTAVGDGGSTGVETLAAGWHTVSEVAASSTIDLLRYDTTIGCTSRATGMGVAAAESAGPLSLPLRDGDDVVCTVTNTRLPTGGDESCRGNREARAWKRDRVHALPKKRCHARHRGKK